MSQEERYKMALEAIIEVKKSAGTVSPSHYQMSLAMEAIARKALDAGKQEKEQI